jgi:hypothetical protein
MLSSTRRCAHISSEHIEVEAGRARRLSRCPTQRLAQLPPVFRETDC